MALGMDKVLVLGLLCFLGGGYCQRVRYQDSAANRQFIGGEGEDTSGIWEAEPVSTETDPWGGGGGGSDDGWGETTQFPLGEGYDRGECVCVSFSQCDEDLNIITDGGDMVGFRQQPNPEKSCEDRTHICCYPPKDEEEGDGTVTGGTEEPGFGSTEEPGFGSTEEPGFGSTEEPGFGSTEEPGFGGTEEPWQTTQEQPTEYSGCGSKDSYIDWRDQTGADTTSDFGEFPWMLLVSKENFGIYEFYCGASLIHPKIALTAAHYFLNVTESPSSFKVLAGEWDISSTNDVSREKFPHQERKVQRIINHPEASLKPAKNDIAVLILEEKFELGEHIGLICLPDVSTNYNLQGCEATGWGQRPTDPSSKITIMKKVTLPIVENLQCRNMLRKTRLGKWFKLHPGFMCAGGKKNIDLCTGDGGGPLTCEYTDKRNAKGNPLYVQVGVTSWGIDCGNENIPGVYTNVLHYKPFLDGVIADVDRDYE